MSPLVPESVGVSDRETDLGDRWRRLWMWPVGVWKGRIIVGWSTRGRDWVCRVLKREVEVEVEVAGGVGIRTGEEESEELEGAGCGVVGGRAVRVGA